MAWTVVSPRPALVLPGSGHFSPHGNYLASSSPSLRHREINASPVSCRYVSPRTTSALLPASVKSPDTTQDDLVFAMTSLMTPLLAGLENRIKDHIDLHTKQSLKVENRIKDHIDLHTKQQMEAMAGAHEATVIQVRATLQEHHEDMRAHYKALQDSHPIDFGSKRQSNVATPGKEQFASSLTTPLLEGSCQVPTSSRLESLFPHIKESHADMHAGISMVLKQKEKYYAEHLHHEEGFFRKLAQDESFKNAMLIIVVLNLVWLSIEADYNKADILCQAAPIFQIGDHFFCFAFVFEIVVRFMAVKTKSQALLDPWLVFDTVLVAMMVWEDWIMVAVFLLTGADEAAHTTRMTQLLRALRIFRVVRVAHVARAGKVLQCCPELLTLAKGMIAGVRAVLAVICLLFLLIYVFAVVFVMTLSESSEGHVFPSVPASMNFLMLQVLCGPDMEFMQALLSLGVLNYCIFLLFIFFANMTLINMLIGILCDVVSSVGMESSEQTFMSDVTMLISRISAHDDDGSGGIDEDEFYGMIQDPELLKSFYELGVDGPDIVGMANFAQLIYEQIDQISYADFARLVAQFRGNKNSTIKDVMYTRQYMTHELQDFEARLLHALQLSPQQLSPRQLSPDQRSALQ